jgi:exosome complex component RRP45
MPREAELANVDKAFILEAFAQNVRLDGRALDQIRNLNITFNDDYGNCAVQLGDTRHVPAT